MNGSSNPVSVSIIFEDMISQNELDVCMRYNEQVTVG